METNKDKLSEHLHYTFQRPELCVAALTHRSFAEESGQPPLGESQRLEFLGDAVLGIVTAEWLFARQPTWREGQLTQVRSRLINAATLARVARRLDLGAFILLGRGEENNGARTRDSLLSDTLEAIFGTLWLDGGLEAARQVFEHSFAAELDEALEAGRDDNPKGELQEWIQRETQEVPRYVVETRQGPAHEPHFLVTVFHGETPLGTGEGPTKRQAETNAARAALATLRST